MRLMLSSAHYSELLGMLCPYCKHGIPDYHNTQSQMWVHSLADSCIQGEECGASRVRGQIDVIYGTIGIT
jgi:hypothetical protein